MFFPFGPPGSSLVNPEGRPPDRPYILHHKHGFDAYILVNAELSKGRIIFRSLSKYSKRARASGTMSLMPALLRLLSLARRGWGG